MYEYLIVNYEQGNDIDFIMPEIAKHNVDMQPIGTILPYIYIWTLARSWIVNNEISLFMLHSN